jgi:2-oxoglutarate ferredoxin oxidoreductase subunit alpha
VYKNLLDRLRKKYETARKDVPGPVVENGAGTGVGILSFGSSYEPVREARDRLSARGLRTDHLLLRALPLSGEVERFLASHDTVFVVEQNRDGQMMQILRDDYPQLAPRLRPVLIYDGLPPAPGEIVNQILEMRAAV